MSRYGRRRVREAGSETERDAVLPAPTGFHGHADMLPTSIVSRDTAQATIARREPQAARRLCHRARMPDASLHAFLHAPE